jgi:anthranilate phosphoribosyltransferase
LGIDWSLISLEKVQHILEETGIGFVYTPQHFPLINSMWEYREQLGKRPPFATMELIWCPYAGESHLMVGFVHPPTEAMFQEALSLRGVTKFTTIKGLEGSCDLPRDRTAIIGLGNPDQKLERLHLVPREYGFTSQNVPLNTPNELITQMQDILAGKSSELMQTALWNGGFYLWRCGICADLQEAFMEAERLFATGAVAAKLEQIKQVAASISATGLLPTS